MTSLSEKLKRMQERIDNMPDEEFEEKLIKAGFFKYKPGPLAIYFPEIIEKICEEDEKND